MDKARQKALKLAYKLALPPMGIYAIRNLTTGRTLLDSSANLVGALNRHGMELRHGTHRHRELMADWRVLGEAQFVFEVLEQIKASPEPDFDYAGELTRLLTLWQGKLRLASTSFYR